MATIEESIFEMLDQLLKRLCMFANLAHPKDRERIREILVDIKTRSEKILSEIHIIMQLCDEFNELTEVK